ncbi:MAG: EAL domain-containing protein [Roseobacter sp.]
MDPQDTPHLPEQILQQVPSKSLEGVAIALADKEDGAVMVFKWCNSAFNKITGYSQSEVIEHRGTILVGKDTEQGNHLLIIDKLMNWENFSVITQTNRKNGEAYSVKMSWAPLSDQNGDRWWLCSLIEMDNLNDTSVVPFPVQELAPTAEKLDDYCREIERLQKENKRLYELAKAVARESTEDPLTGLSNRRQFEVSLRSRISALKKGGADFAVIYIDLDRFKQINDTLGHEAGDALLILTADVLRKLCSSEDEIARLGGDEFVVLRELGDSALSISGLADAIISELHAPFSFEGKTLSTSASIGVAIADTNMEKPEQVVSDADTALYYSKEHGRAKWSFFTSEMHANAVATKRLAAELLIACEKNEFLPYFQPIVDSTTGRIVGAETLVRWAHPTRGILPPNSFLDVAGSIGLLNKIDKIVFQKLCEYLPFLDDSGVSLSKFSINVSASRLEDSSFIHDFKTSNIDPKRLTVEILESVYLERMGDKVAWALNEIKSLGIAIAVDDFGTGHASVQALLKIVPSILKIDRQFIESAVKCGNSAELAKSLFSIGHSLDMTLVAEGIETEAHARFARENGCEYLQGYLFGRPMNASQFKELLVATNGALWNTMREPTSFDMGYVSSSSKKLT